MHRPIITLTTDFGTGSAYVAQMKGVILGICPEATIVDITHAVPPQNIMAGAIVLRDTTPHFPADTIHVAVVDPGVGTERKIIYVEGAGQRYIGPDNGLLSLVATNVATLIAVTNSAWWRQPVSNTFHGRDIMAPLAAHLGRGVSPGEIGSPMQDFQRLALDMPTVSPGKVLGSIVHFDSFGNAITNITRQALESSRPSPEHQLRIKSQGVVLTEMVRTYSQGKGLIALFGSGDFLELALVNGSAEDTFGLQRGHPVTIEWFTRGKPGGC